MSFLNIADKDIKLTIKNNDYLNDFVFEIIVNVNYLKKKFDDLNNSKTNEIYDYIELTDREIEVLKHISKGKNNKEIAEIMNISKHTVKMHVHNIFAKLASTDRTEAVIKAIKANIIEL